LENSPDLLSKDTRRELYSNRFLIHDSSSSGWPSHSLPSTLFTGHAGQSPEPGTPPSSSSKPGTQEKKPTDEDEAKTATPQMEEFLVKLMNDLYKWAETKNDRAVLEWFTTKVR
jgi:hypothetical protein